MNDIALKHAMNLSKEIEKLDSQLKALTNNPRIIKAIRIQIIYSDTEEEYIPFDPEMLSIIYNNLAFKLSKKRKEFDDL